jgi:hypothetical protein
MKIRPISQEDNEYLCALCEHAMPGNISISLERRPDFFMGSRVQTEEPEIYVCVDKNDKDIVGVFSIGKRRVWLNGLITTIRYLSDLRLEKNTNRAKVLFVICSYINAQNFLKHQPAQTIVFEDNSAMKKVIEFLNKRADKHGGFKYYQDGKYVSHMLHVKNKEAKIKTDISIRRAGINDIEMVNHFLLKEGSKHSFFPYYQITEKETTFNKDLDIKDFFIAEKNAEIIGLCAVWDQSGFKQTRIKSYSKLFRFIRPINNFIAGIFGGFKLPKEGEIINYLNLHCVLIQDNNIEVMKALLNEILNEYRDSKYEYVLCGMSERAELQVVFQSYSSKRSIKGNHYLVGNEKPEYSNEKSFYLELSRI